MQHVIGILVAVLLLVLILWMCAGSYANRVARHPDQPLDPGNTEDISYLLGVFGGTIEDAAIARFALQRFEETHGRKATVGEVGHLVGLMQTLR